MKKNFFLLGLFAAVAFVTTLAVHKYFTHNHNPVPATASQPASETTTQTSEEPAPVAQVHGDSTTNNVVEITFSPKFTFATSPVGKTNSK